LTGASIRARGWGWRHAGRSAWAVSGLDLAIDPGERVLLLGASGSGKSTLVHGLAGVLGGDEEGERSGELLVDGVVPDAARGRVGLLLQDPDSQVILARVGDDVAFGCENLGVPRDEIWRRVAESLEAVGLDLRLDHPTSELSGGQKQRLALAGVLAMRPGLILLDEPTANLDPDGVVEVRDAVRRVLELTGATLLVIEHRVAVWQDLVDRVVVLDDGTVRADGPIAAVLEREGASLAESGVWVPGYEPVAPPRVPFPGYSRVLHATDLSIGRERVLHSGIELELAAGRLHAVTGPNGAGKSALGLTIAGLLAPLGGAVVADAYPGEPMSWKSRDLVTRIGTVFQDPEHQFLTGRVRDELAVGPKLLGMPSAEVTTRIEQLAARLRLDQLLEANPFTLSGGEKRRLSVATVLATKPPILVLDEPTFGQDSRTWRELVALIAELLDEGVAALAITHDEQFVAALADSDYRMAVPEAVSA
jgi:energy-coupling factor transporter ATP-binding protein EcfA2